VGVPALRQLTGYMFRLRSHVLVAGEPRRDWHGDGAGRMLDQTMNWMQFRSSSESYQLMSGCPDLSSRLGIHPKHPT
jgi:hypothetical protein